MDLSAMIKQSVGEWNKGKGFRKLSVSNDGECDAIISSLRSRAKLNVIEKKRLESADDESFFALAKLITDWGSPTMTYDDFKTQRRRAPECVQRFFTASNFLLFSRDEGDAIGCEDFLRFVQRSILVETTSLQLLVHARESSNGFMTEDELERYIFELIPEMQGCQRLHESFYPYYVFTSARRFFFFLDPKRTKRVKIKKIAHSTIMGELLYLRRISLYQNDMDASTFTTQTSSNWFSGHNALRVYTQFIDLDKDQNGMLSKEELMAFQGNGRDAIQLTRAAVTRIFEENITYQPEEMDYKTFLDLILALDNKTTPEAMMYFWRVLDLEKCGRLSPKAITYFYNDIFDSLRSTGYEMPFAENIVIEVFDILACNDSRGPTFDSFIKSGQGHTIVSMLLDVHGFWAYDNRESLMQHSNSNEETNDDRPEASSGYVDYGGTDFRGDEEEFF